MKITLGEGVRLREETFGGICYVPQRDDFFAVDKSVFRLISPLSRSWSDADADLVEAYRELAKLGICSTRDPETKEESYCGPSFVGKFGEIPVLSQPLVINCFCTAHCPLKCIYCHADDLMMGFRVSESDLDLESVARTASLIPSIVAVITGGDPLTKPERARKLIEILAPQKALVLDTSGVGNLEYLLPTLVKYKVHVRVSLDANDETNDHLRPINKEYVKEGSKSASREKARHTIKECLAVGLGVTVQTVVSSRNEKPNILKDLRDWLIGNGVRNWVLHVAVKGGMARKVERRAKGKPRGGILPSKEVGTTLRKLILDTQAQALPIDIRCTDTDPQPSSVMLVGSKGDIDTEGRARNGKSYLYLASEARPDLIQAAWNQVDKLGHAERYLNWLPWLSRGEGLEADCFTIPLPHREIDKEVGTLIERETKYSVRDNNRLMNILRSWGYEQASNLFQRDEYFDTTDSALSNIDNVVKLTTINNELIFTYQGPRAYRSSGEYSWMQIRVHAGDENKVRSDLSECGLKRIWYMEKHTFEFKKTEESPSVCLHEIPKIGFYVEIPSSIQKNIEFFEAIKTSIGNPDSRSYRDIFTEAMREDGRKLHDIQGASFSE